MDKGLLRLDLHDGCSGEAKYERLKNHLVNEMLAGRLRPGQALPSENHLVQKLGVARMTIRQAMVALENDGLIRRVRGKGNFVEADARRKLKHGLDIFALVVPETCGGFYPSLLHGFVSATGAIHHQALICTTDDDLNQQAAIMLQLLDQDVGGVAINPTSIELTPPYQVRQFHNRGIPVVFCHRRVQGIIAPLLAIPFHDVGYMAGKVLVEHGHRQVAFLTSKAVPTFQAYEDGFYEALRTAGPNVFCRTIHIEGAIVAIQEEAVWAVLQQLFQGPYPPTAIWVSFDSMAETIYLLMPRLGLRVPEDVSILGFGGARREGTLTQRLTSVVIDEIALGRQAVSLLHEMRSGDRPIDDNEEFMMELGLSDGETLAAPSQQHQHLAS